MRELVRLDQITAEELGTNREIVRLILTQDLGMTKIFARMVTRNFTEQQRTERRDVSGILLDQSEFDPG